MFRNSEDLQPYKDFNKVIKEFFREIQVMFPNVPEAKKPIFYYKLLKTINKRQPQKRFQQILGPYTMQIVERNESFFLSSFSNAAVDDIIMDVRRLWGTMPDNHKNVVWDYMYRLINLSYICEQKRAENMKRLF